MGANTISERLAYLLADHNIKDSRGILMDLRDLEEKVEKTKDRLSDADHPDELQEDLLELWGVELAY